MPTPPWSLIIPVKQTAVAKSRLLELGDSLRRELALAFALDTVTAALGCPDVDEVVVVTNDGLVSETVVARGARVVPDEPDAGLNPALESAAAAVWRRTPAARLAVMSADLPAVRASDLSLALTGAPDGRWFVPDHSGAGTTMLGVPAGIELRPAFGSGSRAAHLTSGAVEVGGRELLRLRLDVDTVADLAAAVELGVGAATTAVLIGSGWSPQQPVTREAG